MIGVGPFRVVRLMSPFVMFPQIRCQLAAPLLDAMRIKSDERVVKKISDNMRKLLQEHIEGHRQLKVIREAQTVFQNNTPPKDKS